MEFIPVKQLAMETNDDLFAWTGMRNAPIAMYEDEPPQSTWLEILLLAERIGSGPSLIPEDPLDRALMMGLSTEICSPDGFAWNRRLEMMGRPSTRNPSSDTTYDMKRMTLSYGVSQESIDRAPGRIISIMQGLATQLRKQRNEGSEYFVGDRVARWFFAMSERPAVQRGKMLGLENQPEEIRARTEGAYYGANGPAPGAP